MTYLRAVGVELRPYLFPDSFPCCGIPFQPLDPKTVCETSHMYIYIRFSFFSCVGYYFYLFFLFRLSLRFSGFPYGAHPAVFLTGAAQNGRGSQHAI